MNGSGRSRFVAVEFGVFSTDYSITHVTDVEPCRLRLEAFVPRGGGRHSGFFSVTGAPPHRVAAAAEPVDTVEETRAMNDDGDTGIVEFVESGNCMWTTIAEAGGIPRGVEAENAEGRVLADVPPTDDAADLLARIRDAFPDVEVLSKRERDGDAPLFTRRELRDAVARNLTEKQREALVVAYDRGYFDWPRKNTAQAIAADLDVSAPTFLQHLRKAEGVVMGLLFDERVVAE